MCAGCDTLSPRDSKFGLQANSVRCAEGGVVRLRFSLLADIVRLINSHIYYIIIMSACTLGLGCSKKKHWLEPTSLKISGTRSLSSRSHTHSNSL